MQEELKLKPNKKLEKNTKYDKIMITEKEKGRMWNMKNNQKILLPILTLSILLTACAPKVKEEVTTSINNYNQEIEGYQIDENKEYTQEELNTIISKYEEIIMKITEESKKYKNSEINYIEYENLLNATKVEQIKTRNIKEAIEYIENYEVVKQESNQISFDANKFYANVIIEENKNKIIDFKNTLEELEEETTYMKTISIEDISESYFKKLTQAINSVGELNKTNEELLKTIEEYEIKKQNKELQITINNADEAEEYIKAYQVDMGYTTYEENAEYTNTYKAEKNGEVYDIYQDLIDKEGNSVGDYVGGEIITSDATIYSVGSVGVGSFLYSPSKKDGKIPVADYDEAIEVIDNSETMKKLKAKLGIEEDSLPYFLDNHAYIDNPEKGYYYILVKQQRKDDISFEKKASFMVDWLGRIHQKTSNGYEIIEN